MTSNLRYLARASDRTVTFFNHVVHTLALFEDDVKFGDQAATNLVLFEQHWRRGIEEMTFGVLGPLQFPSGGVYYVLQEPQRQGIEPVLVHNNFLIGRDLKIQRFRDHAQWYLEHDPGVFWDTLCSTRGAPEGELGPRSWLQSGLLENPVAHMSLSAAIQRSARGEDGDADTHVPPSAHPTVLLQHPCDVSRVIVVVSVGSRPWVPLLWPRMLAYAARTRSDLVLIRDLPMCNADEHDPHSCGKWCKLVATKDLLQHYDRVLVLDDTVVVRGDCPDVFAQVPREAVGAVVEDERVRSSEENSAFVAMSCLDTTVEFNIYNRKPAPGPLVIVNARF